MMSTSRRGKAGLGEPHAAAKTNQHQYRSAPVFEPTISTRFACLSRLLKYLGGHLKSLKLFKTEKAGVGGSTPSLATIISKDLAKDYVFLPVRSQSVCAEGDETGRCTQMISSNLVRTCSSSVRFQSALVCRVAENPVSPVAPPIIAILAGPQIPNHAATTLFARRALTSRMGGWPKKRLYSRLNWLTLSYPTS